MKSKCMHKGLSAALAGTNLHAILPESVSCWVWVWKVPDSCLASSIPSSRFVAVATRLQSNLSFVMHLSLCDPVVVVTNMQASRMWCCQQPTRCNSYKHCVPAGAVGCKEPPGIICVCVSRSPAAGRCCGRWCCIACWITARSAVV